MRTFPKFPTHAPQQKEVQIEMITRSPRWHGRGRSPERRGRSTRLELDRLFDRKVGGLCALQNPVHVAATAPEQVGECQAGPKCWCSAAYLGRGRTLFDFCTTTVRIGDLDRGTSLTTTTTTTASIAEDLFTKRNTKVDYRSPVHGDCRIPGHAFDQNGRLVWFSRPNHQHRKWFNDGDRGEFCLLSPIYCCSHFHLPIRAGSLTGSLPCFRLKG